MVSQFAQVSKEQLVDFGAWGGTDLDQKMTKSEMLSKLEEDGLDGDAFKRMLAETKAAEEAEEEARQHAELQADMIRAEPEEPEEEEFEGIPEDDNSVLVRMTRKNSTYEIRGYRFTQQHPYAMVADEDAEFMIRKIGGFRPATGREIKEFYGE